MWISPGNLAILWLFALSTSLFQHSSRVRMVSFAQLLSFPEAPKAAAGIVKCRFRVAAESSDSSPIFILSNVFFSVVSPCFQKTCFKSTEHLITLLHHLVSKENLSLLKLTRGSWKKSPHTTSCTPPNGRRSPRALDARKFRFSKN